MKLRLIAVVAAVSVFLSLFSPSFAASASTTVPNQSVFKDVNAHWAKDAIAKWSGYGVINGYGGLFRPNDSITRAEMACILNNMMGYRETAENTYSDLKADQFYTNTVLKVKAAGVLPDDGDEFFHPAEKLTREEAAVILANVFAVEGGSAAATAFKDADGVSSWAKSSVFGLEAKGYIKGYQGYFNPKVNITRAEVVTIINNIVKAYYTKAGSYTGDVAGTAVIKVPDVILKNVGIAENLIVAEGVGQGDATLDSVTVKGDVVVRGGGENSIHIDGTSNIANIKIEKVSDKLRIVIGEGNTIKELEVVKGTEIIITGSVGTVEINAPDAAIFANSADIASLVVSGEGSSINLNGETKLGSVTVSNTAGDTTIKAEKGAVLGTVTASAKTAISGEGAIEKVVLKAGASNSSITTPNTKITADAGVTGATAGGTAIAPGSTATNNSTGNGTVPSQPAPTPQTPGPGNGGGDNNNPAPTIIAVSGITVSPTSIELEAGGATATITATVSPANATNRNVIWSSSNTGVATVASGIVTPVAAGTATITATSAADGTKYAAASVTVVAATPDPDDTTPPTLFNGMVEDLGSSDGTTASVIFQASEEAGEVKGYYIVQDASAAAPDVAAIKETGWFTSTGNPSYYQLNVSGLTAGGHYTAYIVMEDASGNTSEILVVEGINPYSNASLTKLSVPDVTLSPNNTAVGGLAYTVTPAMDADESQIKEYSLVIAASTAPEFPVITVTVPKSSLSGTVALANGITAGTGYVARVKAIVTDANMSYQNSDYSADTAVVVAPAESVGAMEIDYVSSFNRDSEDKDLQFSFSGSNDAPAASLTIDTTKLKIVVDGTVYNLSGYSKSTSGLPGTYQLLYGETPDYVRLYLTDDDYNAIVNDVSFTSPFGTNQLVAEAGWASINSVVSGQTSEADVEFTRNLAIVNDSDEYIAKYQLPQNYHRRLSGNVLEDVRYDTLAVTFYSEMVADSSQEPGKGYKISKNIVSDDTAIGFVQDDVWTRLSAEETPASFAPSDQYYKVEAADTDRVKIDNSYYKVAQGVAGRINSLLTVENGNPVDRSDALMFKFTADGRLEAVKVVGTVNLGIDLVGHFAPAGGIPVYLDSDTAKLTVINGSTIGNVTVLDAANDYSGSVWITGNSKAGDITLVDGVELRVSGSNVMTQVGNVGGTGAFTVSVEVGSNNGWKASIGDISLGNAGILDLRQNNANDLSAEYFTIGDVTATTGGAVIDIPNATNEDCNPYGWFMKFSALSGVVTFKSGNDIYTPPSGEVTISGSSLFTPTLQYGVFTYYDTETYTSRFFFTDAVISSDDLENDSKTFKFTAVDPVTHKSSLVAE